MTKKELANPAALGLGGFALTTFILNIVNAELIPKESLGIVLPMGLFYGGMAQFCALCAWYCSASLLLESCYGREVLPLGKVKK
jgi:succinate-acetate transporter protein